MSASTRIADNITSTHVLEDVMASPTTLDQKLSETDLAVLELPSITKQGFERKLLNLISEVQSFGMEIVAVVQPSIQSRSRRILWIHRWNQMSHIPFKFLETCSCRMRREQGNRHLTCLVGSSTPLALETCGESPMLCATSQESVESLGGTINTLCSLLLSRKIGAGLVPTPVVRQAAAMRSYCRPAALEGGR